MSEQSKQARQERRAGERRDLVPMSRVFELRAVPGQGYVVIVADVPRSALEVVSESAADILPIALAKIDDAISAHASKGVAG
jgi:hypothetical protein